MFLKSCLIKCLSKYDSAFENDIFLYECDSCARLAKESNQSKKINSPYVFRFFPRKLFFVTSAVGVKRTIADAAKFFSPKFKYCHTDDTLLKEKQIRALYFMCQV